MTRRRRIVIGVLAVGFLGLLWHYATFPYRLDHRTAGGTEGAEQLEKFELRNRTVSGSEG